MEEHHLQERHQLVKQQLKDQYFLQRHELLRKHEKVRSLAGQGTRAATKRCRGTVRPHRLGVLLPLEAELLTTLEW